MNSRPSKKASSSRKAKKTAPVRAKTKAARGSSRTSKAGRKGNDTARSKSKGARRPGTAKPRPSAGKAGTSTKVAGKGGARKPASRRPVAPATGNGANRANTGSNSDASSDAGLQPTTLPVAMDKPQDPDELKAKADLQRQEARAPMMPATNAPRPMPPQSGKPIWSLPHSS